MKLRIEKKGPAGHRFLIFFFSFLLTLFSFWLLGFVEDDIGNIPGPSDTEIEARYVDQAALKQRLDLEKQKADITTQIAGQREIQDILRNSTSNSQQTMNQLLDLRRSYLEKNVSPSEAEMTALEESQKIFLENQKKYQEANQEIARLSEQLRGLERELARAQEIISAGQSQASEEYARLSRRHELKVAALKLSFLIPLLAAAAWMVRKKRNTPYAPLVYATFIAVFLKTGDVVHRHFPSEFFKYIALGAAIAVVVAFLVHLIRMVASPQRDWLIQLFKEAYQKRRCPVCAYPIERGPFKHMIWTRKGPKSSGPFPAVDTAEEEKPYSCPACGTRLYEQCAACPTIRPSLLPYCPGCGNEKTLESAE
ncbi:MAG: hypothetical protein ACE15F_01195 [bacterium]